MEHRLGAEESLATVADDYGLSGWQGLYFSEVNRGFRERHPDPWGIPAGVTIAIPRSVREQNQALSQRVSALEALKDGASRLAADQASVLGRLRAHQEWQAGSEGPAEVTRALVSTTLKAIRLLMVFESGLGRTNRALTEDALCRWSLLTRHECATLFSLLARSAEATAWVIPAPAARGWCDVASPHFWGRSLLSQISGTGPPAGDSERLTVLVRSAHQGALANVQQQLDSLRTGALMEINRLARLADPGPAS
jgi:hypothetical protein